MKEMTTIQEIDERLGDNPYIEIGALEVTLELINALCKSPDYRVMGLPLLYRYAYRIYRVDANLESGVKNENDSEQPRIDSNDRSHQTLQSTG